MADSPSQDKKKTRRSKTQAGWVVHIAPRKLWIEDEYKALQWSTMHRSRLTDQGVCALYDLAIAHCADPDRVKNYKIHA